MEKSFFPSVFRPVSPYILSLFFYYFSLRFFSCFFSCFLYRFPGTFFALFFFPALAALQSAAAPPDTILPVSPDIIFLFVIARFFAQEFEKNFLFFLLRRTSFFMLFLLPSAHTLVKIFYILFTIGYHNLKFLIKTTFYCVFSRLKKKIFCPPFFNHFLIYLCIYKH